jgi:hypothetical protein
MNVKKDIHKKKQRRGKINFITKERPDLFPVLSITLFVEIGYMSSTVTG